MAESILRITSTLESVIPFDKTNAEVAVILEWFIADVVHKMPQGLTQAQQNKWKLEQAHKKMLRYVMRETANNRHEVKQKAWTALYAEAVEEAKLVDLPEEPEPAPVP